MRLAKQTEVAIDALAFIGRQAKVVTTGEVYRAVGQRLHAGTVLALLARAGLVESKAGRSGGHVLAKPLEQIRLVDVIAAVEGPLFPGVGDGPSRAVNATMRRMVLDGIGAVTMADVVKAVA